MMGADVDDAKNAENISQNENTAIQQAPTAHTNDTNENEKKRWNEK